MRVGGEAKTRLGNASGNLQSVAVRVTYLGGPFGEVILSLLSGISGSAHLSRISAARENPLKHAAGLGGDIEQDLHGRASLHVGSELVWRSWIGLFSAKSNKFQGENCLQPPSGPGGSKKPMLTLDPLFTNIKKSINAQKGRQELSLD